MFRNIKKYYRKSELFRYIYFGIQTTVVGLAVFYGLLYALSGQDGLIQIQSANMISWLCAVSFAFVTNKKYVFNDDSGCIFLQFFKFAGSRIVTLILENSGLLILSVYFGLDAKIVKPILLVAVTLLNYTVSRLIVFNEHGN